MNGISVLSATVPTGLNVEIEISKERTADRTAKRKMHNFQNNSMLGSFLYLAFLVCVHR